MFVLSLFVRIRFNVMISFLERALRRESGLPAVAGIESENRNTANVCTSGSAFHQIHSLLSSNVGNL